MIAGFRADDEAKSFWIAMFLVRSEFRGRGIGRALWNRLWSELRAIHSAVHQEKDLLVGLATGRNNTMREFYHKVGFRRVGTTNATLRSEPTIKSLWDALYWRGTKMFFFINFHIYTLIIY